MALFVPSVAGFELLSSNPNASVSRESPLCIQEIEVATVYGDNGIRPLSVTPPQYVHYGGSEDRWSTRAILMGDI
jgi:hypothetical protein